MRGWQYRGYQYEGIVGFLRIVGGEYGGRRLRVPATTAVRPTSDRVREAIFDVLGPVDGLVALDLFAGHGVTGFVDSAGKQWALASYAEMACRTAAHNAARQGVFDAVLAQGRDLVIISGSPSCCDMCAPWEGQVLSLDGATPGYPTLAEAEGDGLFHPSCAHSADPYIEGLTRRSATQYGDPERYAAQQQQRYLERGVRGWKMRQAGALDDLAAAKAKAHVREWQGRLREHVAKHDLPRLRYREQIGKAI